MLIGTFLFGERYGINLIEYHSLQPDCSVLHGKEYCVQYGPWGRNYGYIEEIINNNPKRTPPMGMFLSDWTEGLMYRLFFAINYDYANNPPLPVPFFTAFVIGLLGLLLCLIFASKIIKSDNRLSLLLLIICLYVASLLFVNFSDYLKYRQLSAVNGRYLIIIMPLIFIWLGLGFKMAWSKLFNNKVHNISVITALVVGLLFLQGGGMTTYLLNANRSWYFSNQTLINFNLQMKRVIRNVVIGGKR